MFLSHLNMKVNCAKYYHHVQDFFIAILDPSKSTNSPGSNIYNPPSPNSQRKNSLMPLGHTKI